MSVFISLHQYRQELQPIIRLGPWRRIGVEKGIDFRDGGIVLLLVPQQVRLGEIEHFSHSDVAPTLGFHEQRKMADIVCDDGGSDFPGLSCKNHVAIQFFGIGSRATSLSCFGP